MALEFGYITSGFRDHGIGDALSILKDLGYDGVGITLDVGHLHPLLAGRAQVLKVAEQLRHHGLKVIIETGARFVLDPRRKHQPTLISREGRERRLDMLLRAMDIGETLGASALSFWSGVRDPELPEETSWRYLIEGLEVLATRSRETGTRLAFEPEPGMFIADLCGFRELRERWPSEALELTLDIGHLECSEDRPHERWVHEFADILINVHVDDIRDRRHDHLPIGDGEIDFPPIFAALEEIRYGGLCLVELARHSHMAPEMAKRSIESLREITKD